jgi:hypothetical protein
MYIILKYFYDCFMPYSNRQQEQEGWKTTDCKLSIFMENFSFLHQQSISIIFELAVLETCCLLLLWMQGKGLLNNDFSAM